VKKDVRILKGYLTNSYKGFIFSCKWIGEKNEIVMRKKIKIMIKEVEVLKRYVSFFIIIIHVL
jgi:hypothetical protein